LEINAFVLRWVDGAARAAVTDLGIGEMAFGIGLCIAGKGRQSAQPSSHKKQRKIALRDLVAGNNERGQFLGREILHFIEKKFPTPHCARSQLHIQLPISGKSCSRFPVAASPRA
jgi:hypothetical protein